MSEINNMNHLQEIEYLSLTQVGLQKKSYNHNLKPCSQTYIAPLLDSCLREYASQ